MLYIKNYANILIIIFDFSKNRPQRYILYLTISKAFYIIFQEYIYSTETQSIISYNY